MQKATNGVAFQLTYVTARRLPYFHNDTSNDNVDRDRTFRFIFRLLSPDEVE